MLSFKPFAGTAEKIQAFGENQRTFSRLQYEGIPLRGHNGIDFAMAPGTPIVGVQHGVVLEVGDRPDGFGRFVVLGHRWGHSLYAHLSRIDVRKAQQIDAGTQLGLSGVSGAVEEPQLHFGMRILPFSARDGWCGFSDPQPYLDRLTEPAGAIIGAHMIGGVEKHLDLLSQWQPRLALVLDPNADEMRRLRAVCPKTQFIGRIYQDAGELSQRITVDPEAAADWVHQTTLARLPNEVQFWQVSNEILQHRAALPLLVRFELRRMALAEAAGYRCAIFGFSVGNPDLPEVDRMALWRLTYPALEQAEAHGHVVAIHQYGMPNLWGPDRLYDWYVHRLEHQVLRLIPYKKVKFAVTEFGIDGLIQGSEPSGWQDFTDPVNYVDQLLKAGHYLERFSGRVVGYCVFTLGHHSPWKSYEIAGTTASLLAANAQKGTWSELTMYEVEILPGETDSTVEPGPHTRISGTDDEQEEDGDMKPIDGLVDRRLSRAFEAYNMQIRGLTERPTVPDGDTVYLVKDVFTTVNGSWNPQGDPADVPDWARQDYLRSEFLEAGANHHLFAAILDQDGQLLRNTHIQYWSDGFEQLHNPDYERYVSEYTKQSSGWANLFIGPGSSFNPGQGQQGPWCWMPAGPAEVICGGGLPHGHTISTFVVWQAVPRSEWEEWERKQEDEPSEPDPDDEAPEPDQPEDETDEPAEEDPDEPTPDREEPEGKNPEDDGTDDDGTDDDEKAEPAEPRIVQRVSPWIDAFNLSMKQLNERPDQADGDVVYLIKDVFTTRQGSWDPSDQPGSVPEWARVDYLKELGAPDYFDDAGGDHHLFAAVLGLDGQLVRRQPILYWSDGFEKLGDDSFRDYVWRITKERSGWANIPIGPGSSYVPERAETGPWCWAPVGAAEVMCGGGLPSNHHISVFVVWQAVKATTSSDDDDEQPAQDEDDSIFLPVIDSGERSRSPQHGRPDRTELDAMRRAAWRALNPAFSPDTHVARYARHHKLGTPLTQEQPVGQYIVQGYERGIVFALINAPHRCGHIPW